MSKGELQLACIESTAEVIPEPTSGQRKLARSGYPCRSGYISKQLYSSLQDYPGDVLIDTCQLDWWDARSRGAIYLFVQLRLWALTMAT
jgi:hypothetical protein